MHHPKSSKVGFIRWGAVLPLLCISLFGLFYINFRLDHLLKQRLEIWATHLNTAQVSLKDLNIQWLKGKLTLTGLEMTSPTHPNRNRLEIDELHFDLSLLAALKRKVIIEDVKIHNVFLDTPRQHEGYVLASDTHYPWTVPVSVQTELDSFLRNQSQTILEKIPQILSEFDPTTELLALREQLKSPQSVKAIYHSFSEKLLGWKSSLDLLPKQSDFLLINAKLKRMRVNEVVSPKELKQTISELDAAYETATQKLESTQVKAKALKIDIQALESQILSIQLDIQDDVNLIATQLKMPDINFEDITASLFGHLFATHLKRLISAWTLYQSYLSQPNKELSWYSRSTGTVFSFGSPDHLPTFWLKKMTVRSGKKDSSAGALHATLTDLTTDPSRIGKAISISVSGDFPHQNIQGLNLSFSTSNSRPSSPYLLQFSVDRYPFPQFQLANSDTIQLRFESVFANASLSGTFTPTQLTFDWNQIFHKTQFTLKSRSATLQNILNPLFDTTEKIDLKGTFSSGTTTELNLSSSFGTTLKDSLKSIAQEKILKAHETIRLYVENRIRKERQDLENKFKTAQILILQTIDNRTALAEETAILVQSKLDFAIKQKSIVESKVQELKNRVILEKQQAENSVKNDLNNAIQDSKSKFKFNL